MALGPLALCADVVFEGKGFRIFRNGKLWFVLADVCRALDLADPSMTASRLDDDEKDTSILCTPGGQQQMLIVSEPGFYRLVQTSRKPEAKRLDRFMRHEVMPSIREHGCYPPPVTVAPPSEFTALMQLFDEFDHKIENGFDEIHKTLKVIVDNTGRGRKEATIETERRHHRVIHHHFFDECPCEIRCGTKIADENGFIDGIWHHHHQRGAWNSSAEDMIPLAKTCHIRITNNRTSRLRFDEKAFPQFQDLLARMPAEQLEMVLALPKKE